MNEKAGDTLVLISVPDGYCKKIGYGKYFDLGALAT
jgi:hypothetical protein